MESDWMYNGVVMAQQVKTVGLLKQWKNRNFKIKDQYLYISSQDKTGTLVPEHVVLLTKETMTGPSSEGKDKNLSTLYIKVDNKMFYAACSSDKERNLRIEEFQDIIKGIFYGGESLNKKGTASIQPTRQPEKKEAKPAATGGEVSAVAEEIEEEDFGMKTPIYTVINKSKENGGKELNISSYALSAIPSAVCEVTNLQKLDASHNVLKAYPALFNLLQLKEVNLSRNQIAVVEGESLNTAKNIELLNLSYNQIHRLPQHIYHLQHLITLDLSHNDVDMLPLEMGRLPALEEINLSHNSMAEWPDWICQIPNLQVLNISHNKLSTIPIAIGKYAQRLLDLNVANNNITEMPVTIGKCARLATFDISNNKLKDVPTTLHRCEILKKIVLDGNPLISEYMNAYKKGTPTFLQWLKAKSNAKQEEEEMAAGKKFADENFIQKMDIDTPAAMKKIILEIALQLDETRKALMIAPDIPSAMPHAAVVRNSKVEIEKIRNIVNNHETGPAPVINPNEEKLVMLQKSAGAAVRDIKNLFVFIQKDIESYPQDKFKQLIEPIKNCRTIFLGNK